MFNLKQLFGSKTARRRNVKTISCESLESRYLLSTLAGRWSTTASDGSGLGQGDATTVTWSIVPDGTPIGAPYSSYGEVASPSNLVAFLGNGYGVTTPDANYTDEPWFATFQNTLNRWGDLGGIEYVYVNYDDGSSLNGNMWWLVKYYIKINKVFHQVRLLNL